MNTVYIYDPVTYSHSKHWQNFIKYVYSIAADNTTKPTTIAMTQLVDKVLAEEYNAKILHADIRTRIKFEHEKDFILFELKFG